MSTWIPWFSSKNKKAPRASSKDDFVSLSSHELRSPLSIIKWYTEILLDEDAGPLTEDQRKYLRLIESSNQRAIDLVRSLLNVSRLDLDTFSISPEKLSLDTLVSEVVDSLKEEIAKKKIELLVKGEDTTTHIQADKHLCLIVIKNLLSNALFFSKDGGRVEVCVKHVQKNSDIGGIHAPKEGILVSVADNGIGIPETDQPKIYSKMFRASNVKDSEHNGSGLGLYITKGILEYVGGSLWHISTEGKGSTFYALFPIQGMKKKVGTTTLD